MRLDFHGCALMPEFAESKSSFVESCSPRICRKAYAHIETLHCESLKENRNQSNENALARYYFEGQNSTFLWKKTVKTESRLFALLLQRATHGWSNVKVTEYLKRCLMKQHSLWLELGKRCKSGQSASLSVDSKSILCNWVTDKLLSVWALRSALCKSNHHLAWKSKTISALTKTALS